MYVFLVGLIVLASLLVLFSITFAIKNKDMDAFLAQLFIAVTFLPIAIMFTLYVGGN